MDVSNKGKYLVYGTQDGELTILTSEGFSKKADEDD